VTLVIIGSCALLFFIIGTWVASMYVDQNYYLSQIRELNAKLNDRENTIRNLRDGIENLAAIAGCFNTVEDDQ
jgi:hypothetical protein